MKDTLLLSQSTCSFVFTGTDFPVGSSSILHLATWPEINNASALFHILDDTFAIQGLVRNTFALIYRMQICHLKLPSPTSWIGPCQENTLIWKHFASLVITLLEIIRTLDYLVPFSSFTELSPRLVPGGGFTSQTICWTRDMMECFVVSPQPWTAAPGCPSMVTGWWMPLFMIHLTSYCPTFLSSCVWFSRRGSSLRSFHPIKSPVAIPINTSRKNDVFSITVNCWLLQYSWSRVWRVTGKLSL